MQPFDVSGARQIVAFKRVVKRRVDGFPEGRIEIVGGAR